jgi:hypothetical protein
LRKESTDMSQIYNYLPFVWSAYGRLVLTTITNWELQNFEQIDDYNTLASPFFNWTGGFGRLVPQVSAYNISFLKGCFGILLEQSWMGRSQKQGVAKLSSWCVT